MTKMVTMDSPLFAPAGAVRRGAGAASAVTAPVLALVRGMLNRRQIGRLRDMTPEQLCDIGLTPGDVRQVLAESAFFRDPSARIGHLARSNRALRG